MNDQEARELVSRVDAALEGIEALPEGPARALAAEALQCLLELYGEGMSRIVAITARQHDNALRAFAADELIAHLLLLHGLHPTDVRTRVEAALEEVRPYLASHGGNVELLGVENGVATLRLQGSCHGCPSSAVTLKTAIEEAILKAAPDIVAIDAQSVDELPPRPAGSFIPLTVLQAEPSRAVVGATA